MESSISGGRKVKNLRPTINSYMYANARALAAIAAMAGDIAARAEYRAQSRRAPQADGRTPLEFQGDSSSRRCGRMASSPTSASRSATRPGISTCPSQGRGFEVAWKQLMDPQGFYAPYGPNHGRAPHPEFALAEAGDDCQWNGPSWPFATSITLRALANVLNDYTQNSVSAEDYRKTLDIYTRSQRLKSGKRPGSPVCRRESRSAHRRVVGPRAENPQEDLLRPRRPLQPLVICRPGDHRPGSACARAPMT